VPDAGAPRLVNAVTLVAFILLVLLLGAMFLAACRIPIENAIVLSQVNPPACACPTPTPPPWSPERRSNE
jgi:hypothetical protein